MKKNLLFVSCLFAAFTSLAQIPGLLADYNFNTTTAIDGIGPKAHGTGTNITYAADRFANPGAAYHFNGGSSTIALGAPAKANVSTGLTISSWIKVPGTGGQRAIVAKWLGNANTDQYLLMLNGNKTFIAIGKPGVSASGYSGSISLSSNTWYHIVATWDTSGRHQTYVNGVLDINIVNSNFTSINSTSSTNLSIGSQNGSARFFLGDIDDVQLYNRKLSQSEILDLYNAPNPCPNGLVSKYSFNNADIDDEVNNNDASGAGISFESDRFGNLSHALDVVSQTTHLNLMDSYDGFSSGAAGKVSYSFWIDFKSITTTSQMLIAKSADGGCGGNERQFLLRLNGSGKFEITAYGSNFAGDYVVLEASALTCSVGQWYHVVLTYDATLSGNSKYNLYVNSALLSLTETGTVGIGIGTGNIDAAACIGIGAYLMSNGAFCVDAQRMDAFFDDLLIYNKVLVGTEVLDLYQAPNPVGLNSVAGRNNGVVYPNPFTSDLNIKCSGNGNSSVEIISIEGKIILKTEFKGQNFTLNTNGLNPGIYFLVLTNSEGKSIYKTIKN